ncbi:response regulator transcription factor [Cohnella lubricantis]|uniref:Response regulator transcription factor n=1 Tax=Cohnella lubricantis TaxID=2163172 RepID=A0A841TC44_9BACL|nr:response regulator transcription factor [Cohnella lubricantis]MBB6676577.1 response regulator transcription factor [Cohnella lubricantis]MBP2117412.1 DNA-binding response OmpR family regulator [Cohnella lubricantis]
MNRPITSVLVADDEREITELIKLYLEREGFAVLIADNGDDAIRQAEASAPDLIILDVSLGQPDGIEVCRLLRQGCCASVPILFLSCKSEDADIILGLSEGGDDYITKPFSPSQLVARVHAHIRRRRTRERLPDESRRILRYGDLEIDTDRCEVRRGGELIGLSVKEFDLLTAMARQPNRVFSMNELYRLVWHTDSMGDTRTLMVHVSNLRKKIEPDPAKPMYIQTVRGFGYRLSYEASDLRSEA